MQEGQLLGWVEQEKLDYTKTPGLGCQGKGTMAFATILAQGFLDLAKQEHGPGPFRFQAVLPKLSGEHITRVVVVDKEGMSHQIEKEFLVALA